ncbi:OLC1v1004972C1 [Oldenlandia corymbosa var. corymbosa]|uniref:OLC1v1004972C1 n=1 Tax=Oldenlandia corymbosa var. corymbosa TaxID=529605 RepID=A0AAV1DDS6_OLDCO|nr:OLC1v1004972C1 [Oldenlandia corymbosa var. corymbosa]
MIEIGESSGKKKSSWADESETEGRANAWDTYDVRRLRKSKMKLAFIPPKAIDGIVVTKIKPEKVQEEAIYWKASVVMFKDEKGVIWDQRVHFEWAPVCYKCCAGYGHEAKHCRKPKATEHAETQNVTGPKQNEEKEWRSMEKLNRSGQTKKTEATGAQKGDDQADRGKIRAKGLNPPIKQKELSRVLAANKINIAGIVETKMTEEKVKVLMSTVLNQWRYGLNRQFIHCKVYQKASEDEFCRTVLYAENGEHERMKLWDQLIDISKTVDKAGIVGGDFKRPKTNGYCLEFWHLDHSSMMVNVELELARKLKPFKYFNMWKYDPTFMEVVENSWIGEVEVQQSKAQEELNQIQQELRSSPFDGELHGKKRGAYKKCVMASIAVESFMRQKLKEDWILEGDHNIKFFHSKLKKRRMRTRILSIREANGEPDFFGREIAWKQERVIHNLRGLQVAAGRTYETGCCKHDLVQVKPSENSHFMAWLIWQGRIWTKDRLAQVNLTISGDKCCLCGMQSENVEHFFFACQFSSALLDRIRTWLGIKTLTVRQKRWKVELKTIWKSTRLQKKILYAAMMATIYSIWEERNHRIFRAKQRQVEEIFQGIRNLLKVRIQHCKKGRRQPRKKA